MRQNLFNHSAVLLVKFVVNSNTFSFTRSNLFCKNCNAGTLWSLRNGLNGLNCLNQLICLICAIDCEDKPPALCITTRPGSEKSDTKWIEELFF